MSDKPIDIMDQTNASPDRPSQSPEKQELANRVQTLFRATFESKQQLNLPQKWRECDNYKQGRQNPKQSEEHPGSVTNIIHPAIESMISDLVGRQFNTSAKGWEPSDDMYAEQTQNLMDFVLYRNKFVTKVNVSEHDRLELGTCIIKVWFDSDELDGRGLPTFEPISPANFFIDHKIPAAHLLQDGEVVFHAVPRPLSYFRKKFKDWGQYVQRETSVPYDPSDTFTEDKSDEVSPETSQRALLLECYMRDEEGTLYCVHVANNLVLEDSREVLKDKKLQRRNRYPFVMIPCYLKRGTAWGTGDVEMMMPTQDLINELDDQIRMNARLSGNPQVVVGQGAGKGFDFRKWTNKPGLRIPMRDHTSWNIVPPQNVSRDVIERREKAFSEADMISGRPDVNRGENPGQVTAASAIIALQQAGQKGVVHKSKMFKEGWSDVMELLYDEILENWDDEMWIRIDGEAPDYQFVNPANLRNVPRMVANDIDGEDSMKPLTDVEYDEEGLPISEKPMTREAMFDFQLNIGDGLPSDKAFVYQTLLDLTKVSYQDGPAVTRVELRNYLRNQLGIPIEDDSHATEQPVQPQAAPVQPMQSQIPPELLAMLQQATQAQQMPQGAPQIPTPVQGGVPM
ncbi:hypothetical protein PaeBR_18735 [Paenibacillus sp. BR2-3]|uniref:portal protein n=1 Tax=Paenibacillus sp. BR2-3 TaxID=3048494 RepID=UPI00397786A8